MGWFARDTMTYLLVSLRCQECGSLALRPEGARSHGAPCARRASWTRAAALLHLRHLVQHTQCGCTRQVSQGSQRVAPRRCLPLRRRRATSAAPASCARRLFHRALPVALRHRGVALGRAHCMLCRPLPCCMFCACGYRPMS